MRPIGSSNLPVPTMQSLDFRKKYREGRKEQPTREARKTVGVKFFCIKISQGIVHPRV